jgi:hypothetical protein
MKEILAARTAGKAGRQAGSTAGQGGGFIHSFMLHL